MTYRIAVTWRDHNTSRDLLLFETDIEQKHHAVRVFDELSAKFRQPDFSVSAFWGTVQWRKAQDELSQTLGESSADQAWEENP